jgi:hypothetical protein
MERPIMTAANPTPRTIMMTTPSQPSIEGSLCDHRCGARAGCALARL